MIKKSSFLFIVLPFFLYFIYCLTLTYPLSFPFYGKAKKEGINIRLDSNVTSPILGTLKKEEVIKIIDEKYGWYKISLPSRINCYICSKYLKKINSTQAKCVASAVNLRLSPSLKGIIVGKVNKGDVLEIIEEKKGWTKVKCYPYGYGWVYANLVKKTESVPSSQEKKSVPLKEIDKKKKNDETSVHDLTQITSSQTSIPTIPPIGEGVLKKINKSLDSCPANYFLENNNGFILLKIDKKTIEKEIVVYKKTKVWGKIKYHPCVYIEVEEILQ